jgi:hypothetical protein
MLLTPGVRLSLPDAQRVAIVAGDRPSRYGWTHQKVRARLAPIVNAGAAVCARCGEQIVPGEPWDLGHVDGGEPGQYSGPEHRRCNRAVLTHRKARETMSGACACDRVTMVPCSRHSRVW